MKNIKNFNFTLMTSNEGYENKKDALACLTEAGAKAIKRNKMAFKEVTINTDEFLDLAVTGHSFCNLFQYDTEKKYWIKNRSGKSYLMSPEYKRGSNKGCMKVSFKSDEFFKSSQVIFLDIDYTKYTKISDYIDALRFKPTCVYMSYSDNIYKKDIEQKNNPEYTENGIKSRRFRMVYVLDAQLTKEQLNSVSFALNTQIEKDTKEVIQDKCGAKISQYFNGCFGNKETYKTDNIYSYFDFIDLIPNTFDSSNTVVSEQHTILNEKILDTSNIMKVEKEEKKLISPKLVNDMILLPYDDFMKYNRHKYQYIYRVEKDYWIDDQYQFTDDSYFSLYYNIKPVQDGEHRRKKLFERICLRRVMNPSIDPDTLLFDAYEDVHRYFNNDDKVLSVDCLVRNIESAFKYTVDEIAEKYSNNIAYLKSKRPSIILKKGVAFDIADRNTKLKNIRYSLIDEVYNPELSVKDNLEYINKNVFTISQATLYRYCKEKNIKTTVNKEVEEAEIMSLYDFNLSIRKNLENLKNEGIKVSRGKLNTLVKKYQDQPEEEPVKEETTTTTLTNDPLLMDPTINKSEVKNEEIDYSLFKPDLSFFNDSLDDYLFSSRVG